MKSSTMLCWSVTVLEVTRIAGVADIMRDRIRQLIYLDAVILENGQSVFTPLPVLREAWKWGARPDFRQQGCRTRPSRRAK